MAYEKNLWGWMRDHKRTMPDLELDRVENPCMRGMSDANGIYSGSEFWAELKGARRPVRPTTRLRFELSEWQVNWLHRRWRAGGRVWVYVRVGEGSRIARYVVCPGEPGHLERLQAGVTEAELAAMSLLPPNHSFQDAIHRFAHRLDFPLR
jgi:hypothetical protein